MRGNSQLKQLKTNIQNLKNEVGILKGNIK